VSTKYLVVVAKVLTVATKVLAVAIREESRPPFMVATKVLVATTKKFG